MALGGQVFGCGQCLPCRVNRRRMWTHRIMLEATQHSVNSFWTLTYNDDTVPLTEGLLQTLVRKHLTDFVKRLREDYHPLKLRYFNVGEYGEQTGRPHYHLALFNYPACDRGVTRQNRQSTCCSICDSVRRIWGKGNVYSGQLEDASAAYISGYVTKKLISKDDARLKGREKEFASMSLRPGIGAGFIDEVASTLLEHNLDQLSDVPTSLAHGGRNRPLGRYLTRRLRVRTGKEPGAPQSTLQAQQEKLQPLREAARVISPLKNYTETFKTVITETFEGEYHRLLGKQSVHKKREIL
ncbi:replication initiator protein [robinz microvirus RP_32]|nr:replication initiator protein [robinz microvirus RP_32]UDN67497.1 replication initiator protein [robinz microvirus RP_33]